MPEILEICLECFERSFRIADAFFFFFFVVENCVFVNTRRRHRQRPFEKCFTCTELLSQAGDEIDFFIVFVMFSY